MYQSVDYMEKAPDPVVGPFVALSPKLEKDKKWKEQLTINKRMVALMERTKGHVSETLMAYNSLVDALKHFPEEKQTSAYYRQKAMTLLNRVSRESSVTPAELLIVASIFHKFNRDDLAIKYAQQVANLTDKEGYLASKGTAHKFLSELYEEQKKYRLALDHSRQYQLIETEQIENRLTDDAGKKIIKAEAERDIEIKQNEVDRQQLYTYFAIAIAGLVILLSIAIFYVYRREQARKAELQQLNTTKDKLVAILSHDLYSPITNLQNTVSLTNWGGLSQSEFTQQVSLLDNQLALVRNLLDNTLTWILSQMAGLLPVPKSLDVHELVESQLLAQQLTATTKQITLTNQIPTGVHLQADENHLIVIIRNLLQNAIKFTQPGGSVVIAYAQTGNQQQILVRDTGLGMSPERLATLFILSQDSPRRGTANERGTGLGLVLVKELVEANGGQVEVASEEGGGSIFQLTFPVSLPQSSTRSASLQETSLIA